MRSGHEKVTLRTRLPAAGAVAAAAAAVGAAGAVVGAAALASAGGAAGVGWVVHWLSSKLKAASALKTKELFLFIIFVSSLPRYSFDCRKGLYNLWKWRPTILDQRILNRPPFQTGLQPRPAHYFSLVVHRSSHGSRRTRKAALPDSTNHEAAMRHSECYHPL